MHVGSTDTEATPVCFRGAEHRAAKQYFHGTHRCVLPEETLDRIRPTFPVAGLTRIADITGLDRIGVTTVVSIRPNAATQVCSAGKGFTRAAAEASGAMEAIEVFHAENVGVPFFQASYQQVADRHRVPPIDRLPLLKNSLFDVRRPEYWALGWDLNAQEEVALPFQVVPLYASKPRQPHRSFNAGGSNGLASGNVFLEAVCAGLYEVIERDAMACSKLRREKRGTRAPRVDVNSLQSVLVRELVERIQRVGIEVTLHDLTVDTDVPVFQATVHDKTVRHVGVFRGQGAHLDAEIAMLRAVTEALQSRLVIISGARDDKFRYKRDMGIRLDRTATVEALERSSASAVPLAVRNEATATFEGDVARLIEKLSRVGHAQVVVFDLTRPQFDISVVRVVVPGLEGYMFEHYSPGPRAQRYASSP